MLTAPLELYDFDRVAVGVSVGYGYLGQFVVQHLESLGYKVGRVLGSPSAREWEHQLRTCRYEFMCRLCSLTIAQPHQPSKGLTSQHNG